MSIPKEGNFYDLNIMDKSFMLKGGAENKILFTTIWHYLMNRKNIDASEKFHLKSISRVTINCVRVHKEPTWINGYTAEYAWEDQLDFYKPLNEPWSHDNHTALVSLGRLYNLRVYKFPLKDCWRRIHPRDLIFYSLNSASRLVRIISYLAAPLLILIMAWACFHYNKGTQPGTRNYSGIQLAWLRCEAMGWKGVQNALERILELRWQLSWKKVFRNYYNNADHPVVKLSQEVL